MVREETEPVSRRRVDLHVLMEPAAPSLRATIVDSPMRRAEGTKRSPGSSEVSSVEWDALAVAGRDGEDQVLRAED
jgi:hypothetical protein